MSRHNDEQYNWSRSILSMMTDKLRMYKQTRDVSSAHITREMNEMYAMPKYKKLTAYYKGMLSGAISALCNEWIESNIESAWLYRWYDVPKAGLPMYDALKDRTGNDYPLPPTLVMVREEWLTLDEARDRHLKGRLGGQPEPDQTGRDLDYPINMHTIVKPGIGYMVDNAIISVWRERDDAKVKRPVLGRVFFVSDDAAKATGMAPTYAPLPPKEEPKAHTYEVFSLDVWGNALNGYDINDWYKTGKTVTFMSDWDDARMLKELRDQGFTNKHVTARSFSLNDPSADGCTLTLTDNRQPRVKKSDETSVTHGHGRPVLELRRVDKEE